MSWAPVMGPGNDRPARTNEIAHRTLSTKTPSVSVPSWLAAHLEEQNGKVSSTEAKLQNASSPKFSSPDAVSRQPTENLSSPISARHGTMKPAKLDVPCQRQRTLNPAEKSSSDIEPASIPLTIYANGIQLGNGTEFRPAGSPAARSLLADILDGFFPYELKGTHPDGVPLRLVDRSAERFTLPFQPFRGEKRVLVSRENGMERNEPKGTEGGRKGGIEGGRISLASGFGNGLSASAAEEGSGKVITSLSTSSVSMKPSVDEPPSVADELTSQEANSSSCVEPHPILAPTSDGLFRADALTGGGQSLCESAPLTREEFLDRLPKRVIRGGKLIDVRGEIAHLLRPSERARARARGRESAPGKRAPDEKSTPRASADSGPASTSGDVSATERNQKAHSEKGGTGKESLDLQRGSDKEASRAAVRLKVRGLEGLAWVVELPVGATVGQLYETVEKLRRKSNAVGKE
ncbi:hypothetical protein KFL_002000170 [Klebsormidium nitens]|uniref:SEP domain-containing protein n=1 Tax=Klebsormidium nitens TaxID=105231 RepID=A0A1Y1I3Z7_KLENI|nr:hypothetical protein KFL_002000170 [Klebsormidium nitens]|eukprot:GAQ84682.1 hypothetical protein KFL_002000170 [Klebsormidium nitens]